MIKNRLVKTKILFALLIAIALELCIYLWSYWTSTFESTNFFAIKSEYIFDKCARLAGRVSTAIILIPMLMVAYWGLNKIYDDKQKKEKFILILTLFSFNHVIHLLYVILLFNFHGKSLNFDLPFEIGGTLHGVMSFILIVIMPFILWKSKSLNQILKFTIILYLINTSVFMIKTFMSKIKLPEHPAYHNQLGIVVLSLMCLLVLFKVILEFKSQTKKE